jgi:hypothetical protein
VKSFVYTCSVNNVIDNTRYLYFAVLIDESGAPGVTVGNNYYSLMLIHTLITDTRFAL